MGSPLWKCVIFVFLRLTWASEDNNGRQDLQKEILQKLLMTSKFNIYVRPYKNINQTADEPLEVSVSMYILNINIDVKKEECDIQMYFRQEWHDSRLVYDDPGKLHFLAIQDAIGFWTPDLFFVNEKFGLLHTVTKPNIFVRIYPHGRLLYSQRLTVKLACPMNLRKYPFDTQTCILPVESYGYTADDLVLKWKPETTFGIYEPKGFQVSYSALEEIIPFAVNNYSRLELGIHFTRLIYPQLFHVYMPLSLMVVASWVSFWLRPADLILRLTTVLTTAFTSLLLLQSARDLLYRLCYMTALDVWIGWSCLLILASFFENVYVIASHDRPQPFQKNKNDVQELPRGEKDKPKMLTILAGKFREGHSSVDTTARVVFPSVFVLFNVIYLTYYLV